MDDIIVTTSEIKSAIVRALSAAQIPISDNEICEIDAASLTDTNAARSAFSALGDRAALLHNVSVAQRQVLYPLLGIQAKGPTPCMLVRPIGGSSARPCFHIIDLNQFAESGADVFDRASGVAPADAVPPQDPRPELQTEPALGAPPVLDVAEHFAQTVAEVWELPQTVSAADGPKEHLWIYTRSTPFYPSGSKGDGYTPPNDQKVTVNISYTFRAFLNDAESGVFQWLYIETLGHMSTDGMKKNDHNHRGWGNGSVNVKVPAPSGVPLFYDASPANTNNEKSVTTTVGFDVGYQTGSLNYSQSQTETIRDWKVIQKTTDSWLYEMSSPFSGNTDKFPDDGVKYNAGKARHEIKSWPDLTTSVFRWSTMSVYRNDHPTDGNVVVSPSVQARAIFMYLHNFWPTWDGYYWWSWRNINEQFTLDFSVVDKS